MDREMKDGPNELLRTKNTLKKKKKKIETRKFYLIAILFTVKINR